MFLNFLKKDRAIQNEFANTKGEWAYNWSGSDANEVKSIGEIKKINFFVGANNSGKSRFLRGILKLREDLFEISIKRNLASIISDMKGNYENARRHIRFDNDVLKKFMDKMNSDNLYKYLISNENDFNESFSCAHDNIERLKKSDHWKDEFQFLFLKSILELEKELEFIKKQKPSSRKYIPILRSLHVNDNLKKNSFSETVKKNYGVGENVFTGLDQFDVNDEFKRARKDKRGRVKQFELFLGKTFFSNETIEITSEKISGELLLAIGEGDDIPVSQVGDGIQALIILLFPIYTAEKNDWFFIEEPETHLHPGMQRIFIEALLHDEYLKTKNLKYFFTTHSNHFLDMTLSSDEISIFQFKKNKDLQFNIKTNVKPGNEILDLLGVKTSSVFLANTSIWIEGPTDRKYLSKFLRLYAEESGCSILKEDIDFSFFEYGGNLITHYLFDNAIDIEDEELVKDNINAFGLSNKIYLLADNDNVTRSSKKGQRREALEQIAGKNPNFFYQNTIYKEIENLLPKVIVKDFMNDLVSGDYSEQLKDVKFERKDYIKKGLGEFYYKLLLENTIPERNIKSFHSKSGTLTNPYKIKLVNFVIENKYSYSDLIKENEQLDEIVKKLFVFLTK